MIHQEGFQIRGLELHSQYAWDYEWIVKCLDFMQREKFNALILHRNDFIDLIVYPGKYFGCKKDHYDSIFERYKEIYKKLYAYTPTRRSGPYQRRAFLKRVLAQAKQRNIEVYIENKELYFPDIILEFFPNLVKEGKVCANDPFWWEFTKTKYTEFFEEFPQIAGIITAPATGESKISIKSNRCTCELCKNTPREVWFDTLLRTMYEPIHAAGKKLIVRDFVFDPQAHKEISSVMEALPEDVIISLKNTPHDFYPTFPENTRIGEVGNHEQWIEFDAMGQYFGWGVGIADLTEDYRSRMQHALEKGATGVIFRTDWESLDGHTVFRSPNLINLYAAGILSSDLAAPANAIYHTYMECEGWFVENATEQQQRQGTSFLRNILSQTWEVTRHTPFIDNCVFSDSSLMPVSYDHAFWLAEDKNSLRAWEPDKAEALLPLQVTVEKIFAEKRYAKEKISSLLEMAKKDCPSIKPEKMAYLQECLDNNSRYVSLYQTVTTALILCRYLLETKEDRESPYFGSVLQRMAEAIQDLTKLERDLRNFFAVTDYHPHVIYTLLDADRVECLRKDLQERLEQGGFAL